MMDGELGILTTQGSRRAISIGLVVGSFGPLFDSWEPAMVLVGVVIGEESSIGETNLPTPAIEKAPMMALAGVVLGIIAGVLMKEAQEYGQF